MRLLLQLPSASQMMSHHRLRQVLHLPQCRYFSDQLPPPTMAIRRETESVWERRAPLAPVHVRRLVRNGIKVLVQPSNRRAFTLREYSNAGALIQEDITEASLILGIKRVPLDHENLMPNKTYAFFSHTIKAQDENMELLDTILARNIRLIDYERMLDERGQRVVAFGQFAGITGMVNILHGIGLRFLALGSHSPFMHIGPAHNYRCPGMARQAIRDVGYEISLGNMPRSIGPLIFVFTGSGNVSTGAQELFRELPCEFVSPSQLPAIAAKGATNKVYGCVVRRVDHIKRKSDGGFDAEEFEAHPERYLSTFAHTIAPYMSVLINCIYYAPNAPRLITVEDARHLLRKDNRTPWVTPEPGCPPLPHRLVAIADISADPGGSIEFMNVCTTIDKPFKLYHPEDSIHNDQFDGPGVLLCSIDNLPAQMPRESTQFFGDLLAPHVYEMIKSKATEPVEEFNVSPVVRNAVIASNGCLTPNYQYIAKLRHQKRQRQMPPNQATGKKKILIFGAGHVVPPFVDYLHRQGDLNITIASSMKGEVLSIANQYNSVTPEVVNLNNNYEKVDTMVRSHDLVVNMLPLKYQEELLKYCIKHKINMLTPAVCTDEFRRQATALKGHGITVVMEVGLDPGIDHLLAMQCFEEVRSQGGKIQSYSAFIGGLPAPEFSDNPLRYKFSWNAEASLLTAISHATYIDDGKVIQIKPGGAAILSAKPATMMPGFNLEAYATGDAQQYADLYGLKGCSKLVHGVLRYRGFADTMEALLQLGVMSLAPSSMLHPHGPETSWKRFLCKCVDLKEDVFVGTLQDAVFQRLGKDVSKVNLISQLGLFSDDPIEKCGTPFETLASHLSHRFSYGPDERDVIIMTLNVGIEWPEGKLEQRDISFVVYGQPKRFLATPRMAALPAAIASKMMVDGEIQAKGLVLPLSKEIYQPIIKRLREEGVSANESRHIVNK